MQPIQITLERHSTRWDYSQSCSRKAAYLTCKLSRSIILTAFHTVWPRLPPLLYMDIPCTFIAWDFIIYLFIFGFRMSKVHLSNYKLFFHFYSYAKLSLLFVHQYSITITFIISILFTFLNRNSNDSFLLNSEARWS